MKLSKFVFDELTVAEMSAIKAGSGSCKSGLLETTCDTGESDSMSADTCAD